ncbi:MAG: formylglycine-generating enzyme family protein [Aureisphaera sp.]
MIFITGGEFYMGDEFDSSNLTAQPVHKVLVNSFRISRHEISVKDFELFVDATDYVTEAEKENWAYSYLYVNDSIRRWEKKNINWKNPGFKQSDNHPVTCVSWNDAKEYCKWLSKKTNTEYRLPFEDEWEYISRNKGKSIKYPWGNNIPTGINSNFADKNTPYPWANNLVDDRYAFTAPNGSYSPNEYGVYDLAGNVWEWCENTAETYENRPIENYENAKSMRGGSFHNKENALKTAWRNYDYPNSRYFNLGFRIASSQIKN